MYEFTMPFAYYDIVTFAFVWIQLHFLLKVTVNIVIPL